MRQLEERLSAKVAALDEREKAIVGRESNLEAREAACASREEENRETQRRLNDAAAQLRVQWQKLRVEKERDTGLPTPQEDRPAPRRASAAPSRPPLEERNTLPMAAAYHFPRQSTFEDTPSKIPMPVSYTNGQAPQATPLRRAATKSLGSLNAAYRAAGETVATPAKQLLGGFGNKRRTSIGSPDEQIIYNDDISMASPAPSSIASPFLMRPRGASLAPALPQQQYQQQFQAPQQPQRPTSAASAESSGSESNDQENVAPPLPPTMIPAPTQSFVYREAATPAKWSPEDPDLPSPFLRRAPTAPAAMPSFMPERAERQVSTQGQVSAQGQGQGQGQAQSRQPLGAISLQPSASMASLTNLGQGNGYGTGMKVKAPIPRSRSGNLHQHVLRAAHARTSGEGVAPPPVPRQRGVSRDPARLQG